jgi:signal transduction histidine kinase
LNLGLLVEERIKTCRNTYLQKKKIDFELSIAQNLLIDVDPNYIRQTVDNLVINAITFSEKGVIKISVTKQQNVAVFTISNEGKPIPHTELLDIFTVFRMASNTESQAEGRGVGLALCKAAVEAHGGMIKAENTGKGAKFRFVLPL